MWNSLKAFFKTEMNPPQMQTSAVSFWGVISTSEKAILQLQTESIPEALRSLREIACGNTSSWCEAATAAPFEEEIFDENLSSCEDHKQEFSQRDLIEPLGQFMSDFDITPKSEIHLPKENPVTFQKIDWCKEISAQNLESLRRQTLREDKSQVLTQDEKIKRLSLLISICLKTGNISLAMLLFSHLEAATANQLTKVLMEKVQQIRDRKKELSNQIAGQNTDAEGSKNIQKLRNEVEDANDDITVLQTFIREVGQDKRQSMELANAFLTGEHETAMSIIRSSAR